MPAAAAGPSAGAFEQNRKYLLGLAYRMLGSLAEAEDVVQEAWLRWQSAAHNEVASPRGFLRKIATRLCLDQLKSARARREEYVGPWLPEPVAEGPGRGESEPMLDRDVTMGLMLALERLTPPQRAAFLLHDMFDVPFSEIAETLGQSEGACRQHAARARREVRGARRRFEVDFAAADRLTGAFLKAARDGDEGALKAILAEDVVIYSDGGGIRPAARNLITGLDRAARFFLGLRRKLGDQLPPIVYRGRINASPGFITLEKDGLPQAFIVEAGGGKITAIYIVRNPEKLRLLPVAAAFDGSDRRTD
jgi:RNA polymerase sigma-70 factor (ECF subfamily)